MNPNEPDELSAIEKLARREARTNDDGTVRVEVWKWHEEDGHVTVEFLTPTNEKKSETMPFPKAGGDLADYKFYRILQTCDLSVRNADLLEGETLSAKLNSSGNWVIYCPPNEPLREILLDYTHSLTDAIIALMWIAILLFVAIALVVLLL